MDNETLITLTADIVSAHVSHNNVATGEVPALIQSVFTALNKTTVPDEPEVPKPEPAVAIRSSVKNDYIVCLEDGQKLKMLKRYLRTNYDMSPDEYREKWGLPRDYPMVAPAYAEQRRSLAHKIGLGRKKGAGAVGAVTNAVKRGIAKAAEGVEAAAQSPKPAPKPRAKKAPAAPAEVPTSTGEG